MSLALPLLNAAPARVLTGRPRHRQPMPDPAAAGVGVAPSVDHPQAHLGATVRYVAPAMRVVQPPQGSHCGSDAAGPGRRRSSNGLRCHDETAQAGRVVVPVASARIAR